VEGNNDMLSENSTMVQIKMQKKKEAKKTKVKSCLFIGVSQMILTRIMKSPKKVLGLFERRI